MLLKRKDMKLVNLIFTIVCCFKKNKQTISKPQYNYLKFNAQNHMFVCGGNVFCIISKMTICKQNMKKVKVFFRHRILQQGKNLVINHFSYTEQKTNIKEVTQLSQSHQMYGYHFLASKLPLQKPTHCDFSSAGSS